MRLRFDSSISNESTNANNYRLTYILRIPYIPHAYINSANLIENIILRGEPTAPTTDICVENDQIATTEYVALKLFTKCFVHTSQLWYNIYKGMNLVVDSYPCTVNLPASKSVMEGTIITVVNSIPMSGGGPITIKSDSHDIMHNSTYLPPQGGTTLDLYPNSIASFMYIHSLQTGIHWWSVTYS